MPSAANAQSNTLNIPLTDEQVDLVTGLWHANNIPAADIGQVMEWMAGEGIEPRPNSIIAASETPLQERHIRSTIKHGTKHSVAIKPVPHRQ